jgi:glyceraldehyde 3-phosphate dehydrogenase
MKTIGINGFGRIGRNLAKAIILRDDITIALINDLGDIKTLMHLFKYDSVHGVFNLNYTISENTVTFENGKKIVFSSEKNPELIPWGKFNVETVIESTGLFLSRDKANLHINGGAKKVILSAPAKDADIKTIVMGVNEHLLDKNDIIVSNASCTTNSAAPMISVILELCNIETAYLSTVHSYTSDQRLHDSPHSDLRRARAAAQSIIPTSTGAAKALVKIFPELKGSFEGSSFRVPTPNGSITDLTLIVDKELSAEEINNAFKKAAEGRLKGIIEYTTDPIVSIDIVGNTHSTIFDSELTTSNGKLIKLFGWYDNEVGYSNRLVDLCLKF